MTTAADRTPDDPRLSPILLRRALVAAGWTDRMIARAVARGDLAKVRRGAYVGAAAWDTASEQGRHELRARSVVAQAERDLVVSHASALACFGAPCWGLDLASVQVTTRDGSAGRAEAGVRRHRGGLEDGDVVDLAGLAVTSPTRAALELTTAAGAEASLVQVNDLMHRELTSAQQLRERYERSMEHWPRSLATDLILRLADGRCESVAETRFYFLCWRNNLPAPVPQYEIRDSSGHVVARVDFAWPQLGVFLEVDGKVKYGALLKPGETPSDVVVAEKRREDLIRRLTGWRCVRIVWADLERPERTALMLRQELFPGGRAA